MPDHQNCGSGAFCQLCEGHQRPPHVLISVTVYVGPEIGIENVNDNQRGLMFHDERFKQLKVSWE